MFECHLKKFLCVKSSFCVHLIELGLIAQSLRQRCAALFLAERDNFGGVFKKWEGILLAKIGCAQIKRLLSRCFGARKRP
jgi:hypothetical protein